MDENTTATPERPTLSGFDPFDPAFLVDPPATWARAQRECPVFYYAPMGIWVVTRFDDVMQVVKDWKTFSSRGLGLVPPPDDLADRVPAGFFADPIAGTDPPLHTAMRKAANSGFTRPRIAEMEPVIRDLSNELIDRFEAAGTCDLMQEFCYQLSLRTIIALIGLDPAQIDSYRRWTENLFGLMSPRTPESSDGHETRPIDEDDRRRHWEGLIEATEHYTALIEDRRRKPQDDLVSVLVGIVDDDGAPVLTDDQLITLIGELIAAGNDTTANLMGSMLLYLSEDPEQLAELKADPSLTENAVEEGLRRRGSSMGTFRYTTDDVTLSGVEIPRGSLIWTGFQATGQDESHFPDSRRFDIHRENAGDHLALGRGRHFCLGAPLARLEARVGLETLFKRMPGIAAVPGQRLEYAPVMTVSMLMHLQVSW